MKNGDWLNENFDQDKIFSQDCVVLDYNNAYQLVFPFICTKQKENITHLKKQLQNVEEALEATRQSSKNGEHKSNQLLAEKVQHMMYCHVHYVSTVYWYSSV